MIYTIYGVSGIAKSASRLPRRAIALGCSPRPCAGSRKHRRPRLSMVENPHRPPTPTCIGVTGYPRSGKLPAPLCHRSPTPIQAVRGGRLTLAAASRCSKICPIDRPCQHVCKHRCDRIPEVRQTARAGVPSLSRTHSGCARRPAHSRRRFSMLENLSDRPPTPTCIQASV